jgi:tetratricopeptide (TPR) repeat protein
VLAILALVIPHLLQSGPAPSRSAAPGSAVTTVPLSNEQRASAFVETAKTLLGGGDLDGAAGQVDQALLVVPNHAGALDLRAKIEAERQRRAPAGPSSSAAAPRSPEDADAIQLEWELAGLEDAIRRLRADAAQTPPRVERQIQALDESIRRVRARMRADAGEAYRRARQQDTEGRAGEAIVLYEQALRFWPPDEPNRRAARERLDALRGGR